MKQKSTVTPAWVAPHGETMYFGNDHSVPEGFSLKEWDDFAHRMVGAASCHIAPEIWARLRREAAEDVLKTRTPKEVAK